MSKVYKGYELLKELEDGKLKENTILKDSSQQYIVSGGHIRCYNGEIGRYVDCWDLINNHFELIEDEEIVIDSIKELENEVIQDDWIYYVQMFFKKINELVQAVNQLNKEIKSIKEE